MYSKNNGFNYGWTVICKIFVWVIHFYPNQVYEIISFHQGINTSPMTLLMDVAKTLIKGKKMCEVLVVSIHADSVFLVLITHATASCSTLINEDIIKSITLNCTKPFAGEREDDF